MNTELLKQIQYLSKEDTKTLSQKAGKITEELGELFKVLLPYEDAAGTYHRFSTPEQLLEECADIMLSALSVAYHLNYSHDEIEEMMKSKARKWYGLQEKERELNYPIPFEIHITLESSIDDNIQIATFKEHCKAAGVKPILLDLHTKENKIIHDVMTSSVHFGTNRSVYDEMKKITDFFTDVYGHFYSVIRSKIESIPRHPMAPRFDGDIMPKGCYFESHIPLIVGIDVLNTDNIVKGLKSAYNLDVHMSRNSLKKSNTDSVIMLTFRDRETNLNRFLNDVATIEEYLRVNNYAVGKTHNEFSVYDSNSDHDNAWIKNLQNS